MLKVPKTMVAALFAAALTACSWVPNYFPGFLKPYRPDVQQGNVITNEMVEQLRPGMSRDQVKFMLGTPLLVDAFHKDRWDYMYYLNPRSGATQRRKLTIFFEDNHLARFQSDAMPPESMADNLILGRKGKPAAPKPKEAVEAAAAATPAAAEAAAAAPQAATATPQETSAAPNAAPADSAPAAPTPDPGAAPSPAPAPPARP